MLLQKFVYTTIYKGTLPENESNLCKFSKQMGSVSEEIVLTKKRKKRKKKMNRITQEKTDKKIRPKILVRMTGLHF